MRRKNDLTKFVLCSLVLFLCVGYAVVNSVTLSITGSAAAGNTDLKVSFNGTKTVSNPSKGSATVTAGSKTATFTASNLTLNESITYTYTVQNTETDVAANISLSTTGSGSYFIVTATPTSTVIQPGTTSVVSVVVKMIKTPVSSTDNTASFTITLNAVPDEPKEMIKFYLDSTPYVAEKDMTWEEYINSSYNQIGLSVDLGYVVNNTAIYYGSDILVSASSKIVADRYYMTMCCFDAGMRVLMADGTYKNIEEVEVGDMVMSLNEKTGEYVAQRVQATIIKENSTDLVYVYLSNRVRLGMRAYHPLLTTEGWKSLRPKLSETVMDVGEVPLLEVGDTLVGFGDNVTILSIEEREHIENYNTYNLSIEGHHNYIVEGVVVHNALVPGC